MSMQTFIMNSRKRATWFMSTMPASFWEKQGAKKVLRHFRQIASRVPAYRQVLGEHNIRPEEIRSISDLKKLPILDKKNYLHKFPIEELCLDGRLDDKYLIDRSSGYSGKSFFWPRLREEDRDYPRYMNLAYEQFYGIDRKSTLMIITLGLGSWVGGEKISWATREIALRGKNPFTVITPGLDLGEILEIVEYFKDKYEQIVLVGYPPFVKTIIDEGERRGIDWKSFKVKIGLGGEGYSEDWREYIRQKIGLDKNDYMGIAGGYGAADLGMSVGREYPISVLIRKLANTNKALAKDLFGEETIPSLCQYNPSAFYIEAVDNELVFSCQAGIPLMRYNIHDRGGVIPFARAMEVVRAHGFDPDRLLLKQGYTRRDIWRLPFFYVYGRTDGVVHLYGANIYVENIKSVLDKLPLVSTNTNNFRLELNYDENQNQVLAVKIELAGGIDPDDALRKKYLDTIIQTLRDTNSEYDKLFRELGDRVIPKIFLLKNRDKETFKNEGIKNKYLKS